MVKEGGSGNLPDPEWTQYVLEQIETLLLIGMPDFAAGTMDYLWGSRVLSWRLKIRGLIIEEKVFTNIDRLKIEDKYSELCLKIEDFFQNVGIS